MNIMNLYVYENRSMSNDLSKPLMLENLNVDNVQIHIPKEIDGTDMGTWAWWLVYQNAKREKYSIPMTLEGVTNDEGEEEYISTVVLNHGFTGKHGTVMYAIEAVQADGSGAVTHEWHTRTYKLEIVHTLQGNQTEYSETESDIISALISRVNELITSGAEIAEIAETIESAAETAQGVIDSIPSDYSSLSDQVDTNTAAIALKADAAETGRQIGLINESLEDLDDIDVHDFEGGNDIFPYKSGDVRTFGGLTKIKRLKNYYIFDGAQTTGNLLRFAVFNDGSTVISSTAPTYSNRPAWYSPITSFIVGHRYWFGVKLVSGSCEWTGTSALDNFFDVRVQASDEILYQSKNSSWVCTKIPEMICFSLGNGTYNDAVFELNILDVTFMDDYMPERHAILDSAADKLKLFFITDIHANLGAIQRLSHYISTHSDQIDEVINGGDTARYEFASAANSNYFDSDIAPKALAVIGNHDSAVYDENNAIDWWAKTRKEVYDQYLAPYISGWNVVQPENAATLGLNYYYKDYSLIRIIYLDAMFWDADQLTWLTNVLASAKAGAMSVICVAHGQDGGLTGDTNCNWTWYESPNQTGYYSNLRFDGRAASAINDFIAGGGSFICWITGHTHRDKIGHLTDYPNQFVINMNRSGGKPTETRAAYYSGTLIVVDRVNKVIKLVRCGDNFDAYLRPKHTLCYNYETQTLISQT